MWSPNKCKINVKIKHFKILQEVITQNWESTSYLTVMYRNKREFHSLLIMWKCEKCKVWLESHFYDSAIFKKWSKNLVYCDITFIITLSHNSRQIRAVTVLLVSPNTKMSKTVYWQHWILVIFIILIYPNLILVSLRFLTL